MKPILFKHFLVLLAALAALFSFAVHQKQTPLTVTYDPGGVFVTTTTVPVEIGTSTYSLQLSTASSGVELGLVAANVTSQLFLNQNGNFVFQLLNPSTTIGESNCVNTSSCFINLSGLITASGSYPFAIFMAVGGAEGSVTGTINVP